MSRIQKILRTKIFIINEKRLLYNLSECIWFRLFCLLCLLIRHQKFCSSFLSSIISLHLNSMSKYSSSKFNSKRKHVFHQRSKFFLSKVQTKIRAQKLFFFFKIHSNVWYLLSSNWHFVVDILTWYYKCFQNKIRITLCWIFLAWSAWQIGFQEIMFSNIILNYDNK